MSRLEELIQQFCPDGVEYKKIGDVCSTITDYTAAGSFADIAKNVKYITNAVGYAQLIRTTDLKSGFSKPDSYIYVDEHAFKYLWRVNLNCEGLVLPNVGNCGEVYYISPDTFPNQHNVLGPNAIWVKSDFALNRYLYHLFLSKEFQRKLAKIISPTGQTKFNKTNFKELSVPIPSLEVQREIVRILDQFTGLTAELTAELTTRKKQYEYYRDELLTFENDVPTYKMGDLLRFLNGRAYKQQELLSEGKYPVLRVGNFYTNASWYYSDLELAEEKYCKNGDLLYSWAATLGPKIWDGDKCIFHYHIWKILFDENAIDKNYLFYYLQYDLSLISKSITKSTMIHISMESMKARLIKLPSIVEQRRIASLIGKFDSLCNDLTSGLPAEIEARRKQYEYYRDKLLTFKELKA